MTNIGADDIAEVKVKLVDGIFINDHKVEAKIEEIYYIDGRVKSKYYISNRLCMVSISKNPNY